MLEDENMRDAQILELLGLARNPEPTAAHGARLLIALRAIREICTHAAMLVFETCASEYETAIGRDRAYVQKCLGMCFEQLGEQHVLAVEAGDKDLSYSIATTMDECAELLELLELLD